jgi:hypothetical protein
MQHLTLHLAGCLYLTCIICPSHDVHTCAIIDSALCYLVPCYKAKGASVTYLTLFQPHDASRFEPAAVSSWTTCSIMYPATSTSLLCQAGAMSKVLTVL